MTSSIHLKDVWLKFRIYRNTRPTLKETLVNRFLRPQAVAYSEFYALKNLSLQIKGGDRLGIMGLNGAGKSTLLKSIVGIYPPANGIIEVKGKVYPVIEVGTGFDLDLSGRENIYLNGALMGHSQKDMEAKEKAIIEFSELQDFIDLPLKYYSSGMYGRLAFSVATMIDPDIMLLDEIMAAGDAHFVAKATARMHELFETSRIVVFVSHNLDQIKQLCNRAIVLHHGELLAEGSPDDMAKFYLENVVAKAGVG